MFIIILVMEIKGHIKLENVDTSLPNDVSIGLGGSVDKFFEKCFLNFFTNINKLLRTFR